MKRYLIIILIIICCLVSTKFTYAKYYNQTLMEETLAWYEEINYQGGWQKIPDGPLLKKGSISKTRIPLLRRRLIITNDLRELRPKNPEIFDEVLENSVKRFQYRHGLITDGIVGKHTLRALNIPVEEKIKKLKKNISRMATYKNKLANKYIIVNIPDFKLKLIEAEKIMMQMRVIVGSLNSQTPVFNDMITYLELNPEWIIPYKSSVVVILPKIKDNNYYLEQKNIKVFKNWTENKTEINPKTINWSEIDKDDFSYTLVQSPGPNNPMGKVKFKFPNKNHIYLHDTPDHNLFKNPIRTFSAGCIRIEKPLELTNYFLNDNSEWTSERINRIISSGKRKIINLPEPFPIYIVYWTAWTASNGIVHFRNNVYQK